MAEFTAPDCPLQLTDLTVFDVGALNLAGGDMSLRTAFEDRADRFAAVTGLNTLFVHSNLDAFFDVASRVHNITFIQSYAVRNGAAAHFLSGRLTDYLYSSSEPYSSTRLLNGAGGKIDDLGIMDPILLPLISTPGLRIHSTSATLTRPEKTRLVANYAKAPEFLNVCVGDIDLSGSDLRNCGTCFKCARTLLTLEGLGMADRFETTFDMEVWRQNRDRMIMTMYAAAGSGSVLSAGAIDAAEAAGIPMPKLKGRLRWWRSRLKPGRRLRKLVRRG